jgi:hypothetical protein
MRQHEGRINSREEKERGATQSGLEDRGRGEVGEWEFAWKIRRVTISALNERLNALNVLTE